MYPRHRELGKGGCHSPPAASSSALASSTDDSFIRVVVKVCRAGSLRGTPHTPQMVSVWHGPRGHTRGCRPRTSIDRSTGLCKKRLSRHARDGGAWCWPPPVPGDAAALLPDGASTSSFDRQCRCQPPQEVRLQCDGSARPSHMGPAAPSRLHPTLLRGPSAPLHSVPNPLQPRGSQHSSQHSMQHNKGMWQQAAPQPGGQVASSRCTSHCCNGGDSCRPAEP